MEEKSISVLLESTCAVRESMKLKINYRTTEEIKTEGCIGGEGYQTDDLDGGRRTIKGMYHWFMVSNQHICPSVK